MNKIKKQEGIKEGKKKGKKRKGKMTSCCPWYRYRQKAHLILKLTIVFINSKIPYNSNNQI